MREGSAARDWRWLAGSKGSLVADALHQFHEVWVANVFLKRRVRTRIWHLFTTEDIVLVLKSKRQIGEQFGFVTVLGKRACEVVVVQTPMPLDRQVDLVTARNKAHEVTQGTQMRPTTAALI